MPDSPIPPTSADDRLDAHIATLVSRAVADAPAPPDLAIAASSSTVAPPDRGRRRIAAGAAALAAAAAVVAVVTVTNDDPDRITPATLPATTAAPDPTTAPSAPSAPSSPAPPATPATVAPTTTASPAPGLLARPSLAAARGDVIRTLDAAGVELDTVDEAADVAFALGDGRVLLQTTGGASDELSPADTTPLIWSDATLLPLGLDGGLETDYIELHDVAVIDGRRLVLYTTYGSDANPETYGDVRLWAADVDGGETTGTAVAAGPPIDLGVVGGWEVGPGRLHLASSGLIVGTMFQDGAHRLFVAAVPGTDAATSAPDLTAGALGLEAEYRDCADCPSLFTVDGTGATLAWVDGGGLTRVPLTAGQPGEPTTQPFLADRGGLVDVDLVDGGGYVAVYGGSFDQPPRPAQLVTVEGDVIEVGIDATWAPSVGDADPAPVGPPGTTTVPATSTSLPGDQTPLRLATADADGVSVIEAGQEVRRLDLPAEIALLTPGGAVIYQAPGSDDRTRPGVPQIWRPDGTVERLLAELPEGQSYRLHDLAVVDGIPVLLYGVHATGAEPLDDTETVTALFMDPAGWTTATVDETTTYESGVTRLSLGPTGLVVGTYSENLRTSFYARAVPGTPAADAPLPEPPAGRQEAYADCDDCPDDYAISADGESIVWREGAWLWIFAVGDDEARSWEVPALADQPVVSLDARTSSDGGVEVAMSFGAPTLNLPSTRDAVVVATAPTGDVVETPVAAATITFGP